MFEVVGVDDWLLIKRVMLRATKDEQVSQPEIHVGRHNASVGDRIFTIRQGQTITLIYPGWTSFRRGEAMTMARVLRHPGVGRFLLRQRV